MSVLCIACGQPPNEQHSHTTTDCPFYGGKPLALSACKFRCGGRHADEVCYRKIPMMREQLELARLLGVGDPETTRKHIQGVPGE